MTAVQTNESRPAGAANASFFRQSGWMVFATVTGGILFYAVHLCARKMPKEEYGIFTTLLQVLNQMAIPAMGLQTIFVQEAALAETEEHRRELAGAVRALGKATFLLWVVVAALALCFQGQILTKYNITNPAALWATIGLGLSSLWIPITNGIILGRQNFLWYGWISMFMPLTRLILVLIFVLVLGWYAAGAMFAVLLGMGVGVGLGVWQTCQLWTGPATRFVWLPWLKRVVPLTLGTGAATFMFTFDMIAVQRFLPENSGIYGAAGMIGRAIMFLVAPMVAVMFPKIVQSAAKAERSDVLALALGTTTLLAGGAALFTTFFARIPILLIQGPNYLDAATLVPLFTWCILPLTVSNVLVNNLMARQRYAVVPWLVLVAAAYVFALWRPACHEVSSFSKDDFIDLPALVARLKQPYRAVDAWLDQQLSPATKTALSNYQGPGSDSATLKAALVQDFNRIVGTPNVTEPQLFANVYLRSQTQLLLEQKGSANREKRLTYLLLEDAYPTELFYLRASYLGVIRTLGVFSVLFFLVCVGFTWAPMVFRKNAARTA